MVSRGKHNRFISLRTYKLTILRPRESGMGGGREAQEEGIYIHVHVCAKSLQLYLTLYIPMDCNPPCSSGDSPGKNTVVGCHDLLLLGILLTQGLNLHYVSCIGRPGSLPLVPPGKPYTYT